MKTTRRLGAALLLAALAVGCGKDGGGQGGDAPGKGAEVVSGDKYLLAKEPDGAKDVNAVKAASEDGEEVVVVGRIAGSKRPFTKGRASFQIIDLSIATCPPEENCPEPWDCCCTPAEDLAKASAQVKFVGGDGQTLRAGAKEMFGVKELAIVVVKGKASRDDKGNLIVVASGLHVRK